MRRILNLASNRWNSAITEYAISTSRSLVQNQFQVLNIGLSEAPFLRRLKGYSLETKELSSFGIRQMLRLRQIAAEFRPDLFITHGGPETLLAAAATSTGVPIVRVRGYAFEGGGALSGLMHDWGQIGVKALVTPSDTLSHELKLMSKIDVYTVMLGIDTEVFKPKAPWQKTMRPEVLIFGRFDPVKGHKVFMEIFHNMLALWPSDLPRPLLRVVGLPANLSKAHLEAFATESGLRQGEDIEITADRIEDTPALLQSSTLGVVSSLGSEIICRVAEEFLAMGTPVFVSGVGSLDEVLISSQMGSSYRGLHAQEAAVKLKELILASFCETPAERQTRSDEARALFSLQRMGRRWMDILATL